MFRSLRISHVEFRFPGSEKLGQSRNGQMEGNFRLFQILQNNQNAYKVKLILYSNPQNADSH